MKKFSLFALISFFAFNVTAQNGVLDAQLELDKKETKIVDIMNQLIKKMQNFIGKELDIYLLEKIIISYIEEVKKLNEKIKQKSIILQIFGNQTQNIEEAKEILNTIKTQIEKKIATLVLFMDEITNIYVDFENTKGKTYNFLI
jgi:hypothetical protein